jgi:hypothetical protein
MWPETVKDAAGCAFRTALMAAAVAGSTFLEIASLEVHVRLFGFHPPKLQFMLEGR